MQTKIVLLVLVLVSLQRGEAQLRCTDTQANCFNEQNLTLAGWATLSATLTCGLPAPNGLGTEMFNFGGLTGQTVQDPNGPFTCDTNPGTSHPASFMLDQNANTWWQAPYLNEEVTIQLNFPNPIYFVLTELEFRSVRPARMVIEYSVNNGQTWQIYQFYSEACIQPQSTHNGFGVAPTRADQVPSGTTAVCIEEQSQPSPENQGTVNYLPLPRLGTRQYTDIALIQSYLVLTNLRARFSALYTAFSLPGARTDRNADRYYYGVYRWDVRARCHCFGHASTCNPADGFSPNVRTQCVCDHNTMGVNCQQCLPLFNNRPWQPGTDTQANACQVCVCNNHASSCTYNAVLGTGVCDSCNFNTEGNQCERCQAGYYDNPATAFNSAQPCLPCNCNPSGSTSTSCDSATGQCFCKANVGGRACDTCNDGFYALSLTNPAGCSPCNCNVNGRITNVCNKVTGDCLCKSRVVSVRTVSRVLCDTCTSGSFGLDARAPGGCWECVCSGHTTSCSASSGYQIDTTSISSIFSPTGGTLGWTVSAGTTSSVSDSRVVPGGGSLIFSPSISFQDEYFQAPVAFRGDRRLSLGNYLQYDIQATPTSLSPLSLSASERIEGDLQIVGALGVTLVYADSQALVSPQNYHRVRIQLYAGAGWRIGSTNGALATNRDITRALSNVQAVNIRAKYYSSVELVRLASITMETSTLSADPNRVSSFSVEACSCPAGFAQRDCSLCQAGFTRNTDLQPSQPLDPFRTCSVCVCNNHASVCDAETGICQSCQNNTGGNHCEVCNFGFFGDATRGTTTDCNPCPCPLTSGTEQFTRNCTVGNGLQGAVCINCPFGHTGTNCQTCADGFTGTPTVRGPDSRCQGCMCNCNIDLAATGNCNAQTGQCLRCTRNTVGDQCQFCANGFFGVASNGCNVPSNCQSCICDSCGTTAATTCNRDTGQCVCAPNVNGVQCNTCAPAHWGRCRFANQGCRACNCNPQGSSSQNCDELMGQCTCHNNVEGLQCTQCRNTTFNLVPGAGCQNCGCNIGGTVASTCVGADCVCNKVSGQCTCMPNVIGRTCNTCRFGTFGTPPNCVVCHDCFLHWDAIIQQLGISVQFENNRTLNAIMQAFGTLTAQQITDLLQTIRVKLDNATLNINARQDAATQSNLNGLEVIYSTQQNLMTTLVTTIDRAQANMDDILARLPAIQAFNGTVAILDGSGNVITAQSLTTMRTALQAQHDTLIAQRDAQALIVQSNSQRFTTSGALATDSQNRAATARLLADSAVAIVQQADDYSANASSLETGNSAEVTRLDALVSAHELASANASRLLAQAQTLIAEANRTILAAETEANSRLQEVQTLESRVTTLATQVNTANATVRTQYEAIQAILMTVRQLQTTANATLEQTNQISSSVSGTMADLAEAQRLANLVLNLTLPSRSSVNTLAANINATILPEAEVNAVLDDARRSLMRAETTLSQAQMAHNASQQALDLVVNIQSNLQTVDSSLASILANLDVVRMSLIRVNVSMTVVNGLEGQLSAAYSSLSAAVQQADSVASSVQSCHDETRSTLDLAEASIGNTCQVTAPAAAFAITAAAQDVVNVHMQANARLTETQQAIVDVGQANNTANALAAELASTTSLATLQDLLQQYMTLQMDIQSALTLTDTRQSELANIVADFETLAGRCS